MAHRKFKNNTYLSVSERKSLLYKKVTIFFKKAQKFSNLCDVQLGLIIFSPDEVLLWPSETKAREKVEWYLSLSEFERFNHLVLNETLLTKIVKDREEKIRKLEQKCEEKKMELLFNDVVEGKSIHELVAEKLKGLIKLCALKKAKIAEWEKQLHEHDQPKECNDNNVGEKNDGVPKI
ncbi:hypothetical protein R3W88_032270 [Solanum pinnatisectum]|uniref:MADS-box domain-containing protein n=1 Tax=Solanum pinnatisectum TaxID=50273 RepID=A0AAV9LPB3_9SOLN|nr:hypothetical protein R3W88_032270 [Solanum pinnatisectum]